ncbi:2-keto-4-pentenoate hydratase [Umezawaea tangerina]|uniref:2-keto-4-pentenoate hydratase n=1 Tax=Umezawaea tangerina TaxID=84725 RepID=A0A2T0TFT1_9PSEU|nr:fumarylacetoacetate hydrolase family protein [Umezawaea tangerina]PRY44542.1 2-keto-4-pentenoate hydratase [Umezawaea tangerina]
MTVEAAADRLLGAYRDRRPCAPVRDLIGGDDVEAAYAVQQRVNEARIAAGAAVVGRKIGLTSAAVRAQLGVDSPDFGVLFDDMAMREDHPVPVDLLLQPKVEAEIAFVLAEDVDDPDGDLAGRVAYAAPALEVVDSRIADWDITLGDTVADNASSGLFVLGEARVPLGRLDPVATRMVMTRGGEVVARGTGADCLGDPLEALRWLARTACATGSPLLAGQVVLSGALGPMVVVRGGDTVRARLSGLGDVTATFTTGEERT